VLASNFHSSAGTGEDGRAYSRTDATPGWEALETAVGQVEGGHAVAFSSGMAAIAAVLDLVPAGTRIVAPKDCYFGVGELLADGQQQGRWAIDRVDLTDTASVRAAIVGAGLLWLESPSNPLLEVADIPALCAAGRQAGTIVGVDNTFATPLLQQPLALGADVVVHSATKFIGGHSDLLSGITIARDRALATPANSPVARRAPIRQPRTLPGAPTADRLCDAVRVIVTPPAWAVSRAPSSAAASLPDKNTCPPRLPTLSIRRLRARRRHEGSHAVADRGRRPACMFMR
jgi:hypothetical protein